MLFYAAALQTLNYDWDTLEAGVLDFYDDDHQKLFPGDPMTKREFTYELSDHLPLWAQIDVDNDEEVIDQILNQ